MKIPPARADAFLAKPDPAIAAILIYGPDDGLVRERAKRLTTTVAEDPKDPFRVVEFRANALRDDPARLADEAAAQSLTGGRRVVRIQDAGDRMSSVFSEFLAAAPSDYGGALVIVEAGELGPRSSLRKLFETSGAGAAVPCYNDTPQTVAELVRSTLTERGLSITPDGLAYLLDRLGSDRLVTRSELEKLVLYAGNPEHKTEITLEDAAACVGDLAGLDTDDIIYAAAEGDFAGFDRGFGRLMLEGASPVAVLRAAQRHAQRLHRAAGAVAQGDGVDRAMQSLRPPVFFKFRDRFKAQLRLWPIDRLAPVMAALVEAERGCKRTGAPDAAIAERALMMMANAAARARRQR